MVVQTEIVFYFVFAGIIALLVALFQYMTKKKSASKLKIVLVFLRFLTIFSILLLIINPKFEQKTFVVEKPNLIVAIDNSSSIKHLKKDKEAKTFIKDLLENNKLSDKFNIDTYTFGNALKNSDSITFSETQTNISSVFHQLSQVYRNQNAPTILITDGNQTYGNDYQFAYSTYKQPIYPIILGDTTVYTDLKIQQLNVNKYAYLKNRFPVEVIVSYTGESDVATKFVVKSEGREIYSEPIALNSSKNSKIINFTLPATNVGVNSYKATLVPINSEKNSINNSKNFAVEVIDQKTKIAIVSDFTHPDLGAFKKSIETNEQRSVVFINPKNILNQINDFQLIILYQPNNTFSKIFEELDKQNRNRFVVIGTKTDLNFLNTANKSFQYEITEQIEDYQAELNLNYSPFLINDINFESFPPLLSHYGEVTFNVPFETLLNKKVRDISTNEPLLATFENKNRREAVLYGEDIWKWRAQSYLNSKSFSEFDDFIGKLIQYLASNKSKSRLNVDYESFYNGNSGVIISVQYFDKNYVFDARSSLNILVKDDLSGEEIQFPLVLKNNSYEVDLSSLPPSKYTFTVKANADNVSKSGSFQILEYNVEQQFLNADVTKLKQLATNSGGKSYFINNTEALFNDFIDDNRFVSVQKSNKNSLPLIDWKYLLIIIVLSLSLEWFLRKYNGLI